VVEMIVPARCYSHDLVTHALRYSGPDEAFWPGDEPIVMRGSRHARRWIHDRRYSVRDGYLYDLRDRYLRRFKPTAIGRNEMRAVWRVLTNRITDRWHMEGRKFEEMPWHGYGLIDGELICLRPESSFLARLADELEGVE